ncbi:MAG: hypothetical protein GY952_08740 [Rhodobacteraceae bacterium]|nr:hypothetical protein [Paracoccaceae bacterium]
MTAESATLHPDNPAHQHEPHGFGVFGGVARMEAIPPVEAQVAVDFIAGFLQALADECLSRGADLIGHLKVHLSTASGTVRASLVDPEAGPALAVDLDDTLFATGELTVNAIVHGLTSEAVTAGVYVAARSAALGGLSIEWGVPPPPTGRSEQ